MTTEQLYEIFLQHPVITTDSRNCPDGSIFFALKGDNFNGNRFAAAALDQGCAYAVVDEESVELGVRSEEFSDRLILVDDVLSTLQQLAHIHREHFEGPVLQITGTNGKTTTKELVSAVLAQKYRVLYTSGNLNNHIGVPKTLLRLTKDHDIAVIETGANHPGEIATLANIVDPDCGLITNVGIAHIEGFGSFDGVVKTKGELYDYIREKASKAPTSSQSPAFIFLNADNPHLSKIAGGLSTVTYGSPSHAYTVEGEVVECAPFLKIRWRGVPTPSPSALRATSAAGFSILGSLAQAGGEPACSQAEYIGSPSKLEEVADTCVGGGSVSNLQWHEVQTHLIGSYNIDNVLAAACVGIYFGVPAEQISAALANYSPTNSRSELRRTEKNTLIVDAYNANPSSMAAALDNFALTTPAQGFSKMLILGDMRELGAVSEREHKKVIEKIQESDFDNVWLVGENFRRLNPPFPTFRDVEDVKAELERTPIANRLILIKGSNGTRLYDLPDYL